MELTSNEVFNDEIYLHFDKVRFEHFNTLNINFKDKNILELGSGIGNHTNFILSKKPKTIVAIEGRQENFDVELKSNVKNKLVKNTLHDLEKPIPNFNIKFDWIYNYGLLYHLKNPFEFIENLSSVNHQNMILETCIELDGDENNLNECTHQSQSLSGIGSRPNLYKLIDKLNSIYSQLYYPLQPNHVWFDIHSKPSPVLKRIVIICMDKKVTNG